MCKGCALIIRSNKIITEGEGIKKIGTIEVINCFPWDWVSLLS